MIVKVAAEPRGNHMPNRCTRRMIVKFLVATFNLSDGRRKAASIAKKINDTGCLEPWIVTAEDISKVWTKYGGRFEFRRNVFVRRLATGS